MLIKCNLKQKVDKKKLEKERLREYKLERSICQQSGTPSDAAFKKQQKVSLVKGE